jgi:hypothetical protein
VYHRRRLLFFDWLKLLIVFLSFEITIAIIFRLLFRFLFLMLEGRTDFYFAGLGFFLGLLDRFGIGSNGLVYLFVVLLLFLLLGSKSTSMFDLFKYHFFPAFVFFIISNSNCARVE